MHHPQIFADDITKRTVTNTPQEVIKIWEKRPADIRIVMNQSKEEHQVGFVGLGSVTSIANVAQGGEMARQHGKIVSNTESLGYIVNLQLQQCG